MIIRAGLLIAFTVITMACSDENSFKGNGSTREAAEQSQDSDQAQNYSPNGEPTDPSTAAQCQNSDSALQIELLSQSLSSLRPQTIAYKIKLVSCNGNPISFNNEVIWFDFDGYVQVADFNFLITDSSQSLALSRGIFRRYPGNDLFGNVGASYAHHKTDPLNLGGDTDEIVLQIDLSVLNEGIKPISGDGSFLKTYLRVSQSPPLSKDVPMVN